MLYAQVDDKMRPVIQAELRMGGDAKWYRRLKVIDLSGQGMAVAELAQLFDLSPATVRRYLHTYNRAGLAGLRPGYGQGRPLSVNWTAEAWMDILAQAPNELELLDTAARNWTQRLLQTYLAVYHQITLSQSALSNCLRRAGIRWRRAKLRVHSPDPLYVVKRQRIAELQRLALAGQLTSAASAHPRSDEPPKTARLAFLDSTDLHWCPDLGGPPAGSARSIRPAWPIPGTRCSAAWSIRPAKACTPSTSANEPLNCALICNTCSILSPTSSGSSSWTTPRPTPQP